MTSWGNESCFICNGKTGLRRGRREKPAETIETKLALKPRLTETWRLEIGRLIDGAAIHDENFAHPAWRR